MKLKIEIKSAILLALFIFSIPAYSHPSVVKSYNIPLNKIELKIEEKMFSSEFSMEKITLGTGILPYLTMWFSLDYLHDSIIKNKENNVGDASIQILYYSRAFFKNKMNLSWFFKFLIPTGPNAFLEEKWRGYAFGNSELLFGPILQIELTEGFDVHFNVLYVFRQDQSEDFFGGFNVNVADEDAWKRIFGFNPTYKENFFHKNRFFNDSLICSFQINNAKLYPFLPAIDFYISKRLFTDKNKSYEKHIEGYFVDPLIITSLLLKYFININSFIGITYSYALYSSEFYPKHCFSFHSAAFF